MKLGLEGAPLVVARGVIAVVIEAGLADHVRVGRRGLDLLERAGAEPLGLVRVTPHYRDDLLVPARSAQRRSIDPVLIPTVAMRVLTAARAIGRARRARSGSRWLWVSTTLRGDR